MDVASSSSSSSSSSLPTDVFLSFRGQDTRESFVCHLHKALERKTLKVYIDKQGLKKGDNLSGLLTAIAESKLSIVVFSENYATSSWCLKELVQILDCKANQNQIVMPIFYRVDPSHIRKQTGSFAKAFAQHERDRKKDKKEVQSWRSALKEATNLAGWDSKNYEDDAELIDDIVKNVFDKVNWISPRREYGLVAMDSHLHQVGRLLYAAPDDVVYVGIWGMGGLGKTTIARAVYNRICHQFDHRCFLENVREGFTRNGEVEMQLQFLSGILKVNLNNFDGSYMMMLKKLGREKILVVLDDVSRSLEIDALLGSPRERSFGCGSKVIVTTRDEQVVGGFRKYKPKPLSDPDALELFNQNAFTTMPPSEEYDDLSKSAIEYARGLPLALKILGAHLRDKSASEWEYELEKIKNIPNSDIHNVLKISFDGLDASQKNIFLDIACFFKGMHKEYVEIILNRCGFFASSGLRVLINKDLVSFSCFGELKIHDLLQEIGRDIVRKQPWKHSRLWTYEQVQDTLTQNKAMEVESVMIELFGSEDIHVDAEAFISMTNLRLLRITYPQSAKYSNRPSSENFEGELWPAQEYHTYHRCKLHLNGHLKFLSHKLRVLAWHGYPLKSLPSKFNPKHLVDLDMRDSHIEQLWQEPKAAKELISINLSSCKNLKEIPLCTEAPNLQKLILTDCTSLVEVSPSISALTGLVFLSLKRCTELKSLPSSIHMMKSLKTLVLSGSSNLEMFPEISEDMEALSELKLDHTAIKELPSSIQRLRGLKSLNLYGCSNLEMFPEISEDMEALSELMLDSTAIKELPSSIERLRGLKSLSMQICKSLVCLPDSICNLADLTYLYLRGCSKLRNLPENLGNLKSLFELEIQNTCIKRLPVSILHLKPGRLNFSYCKQMEAPLSSWPSSVEDRCTVVVHLDFSYCNLKELSDAIAYFRPLKVLNLSGNNNLKSLPAAINQLGCLEQLELEDCKRLRSIPELPSRISRINAHNCTTLKAVSAPQSPYDIGRCFIFSNCSQLIQRDFFRDIVETHFPPQGNCSRPFYFSIPGNEIPEQFNHQWRGSSVTARLPQNWFDNKFLGFAICAVANMPQGDHCLLSARCFCTFKGDHCEYRFSFHLFSNDCGAHVNWLVSNHMLVGYVPWSEFGINGEEVNERHYTEAKFEIEHRQLLHRGGSIIERCSCIERCGVRLFFANNDDEEFAHQDFGEPMVQVDNSEIRSLEGCSAERSGSDITSDTSDEKEQYRKLWEVFTGALFGHHDITSDTPDGKEQHHKLLDLSESTNRARSCISSGSFWKRKALENVRLTSGLRRGYLKNGSNWPRHRTQFITYQGITDLRKTWTQKVRVTSGQMQGYLDDSFYWNIHTESIPRKGTTDLRRKYRCTHGLLSGCGAEAKVRAFIDDLTILEITYIGRHTCWKTLPMLTHQVRVTPGMETEGPSDGFRWVKYAQTDIPGAKPPRVYYICAPQNVGGCMAVKEVQCSNDQEILKITYRGRHTCTLASTSNGGRGDSSTSVASGASSVHDRVVQSPSSPGANGHGGNVIRIADNPLNDNNMIVLRDASSQDMSNRKEVTTKKSKGEEGAELEVEKTKRRRKRKRIKTMVFWILQMGRNL